MALINLAGHLIALFRQLDVSLRIHLDKTVFPQVLHGYADTGLGKTKFIDDVDGSDLLIALFQDQDALQIVFCGFLYFQRITSRD